MQRFLGPVAARPFALNCGVLIAVGLAGCAPPPPPPSYLPAAQYSAATPFAPYQFMPLPQGTPAPNWDLLPPAPGQPAVLRLRFPERAFFDFDDYAPRLDSRGVLDAVADAIKRDPSGAAVTVLGHTDIIGTETYNLGLARRRAGSVMEALLSRGVPAGRLTAVAVGKRQPLAPNDTVEGRALNRRVEFLVSPTTAANLAAVAQATPGREPLEVLRPEMAPDNLVVLQGEPLMPRLPVPTPSPGLPRPSALPRRASPASVRRAGPAPAPVVQPARPENVQRAPLGERMEY